MPVIDFARVADKSSEDSTNHFVANNLLRTKDFKSWKCSKWEESAFVILEAKEPQKVDNIEIGNDGSAFVEVLVANSSEPKPRFQVLLSTSSFMTPSDSKTQINSNRIRDFPKDKLSPNARNDKWDRFKIVCKQPFNREVSFGLAFVRFNRSPDNDEDMDTSGPINFGPFKLRSGSTKDDETQKSPGSMFAKLKTDQSPNKTPKQSVLASAVGLTPSQVYNDVKTSSSNIPSVKPKTNNTPKKVSTSNDQSSTSAANSKVQPSPPKKTRKQKPQKPFRQLMSDIVFVLSGFQNPKRSQIRDEALRMGAKYKPDWDRSCTHLICAFANTPKFNEVKSKNGRIVTENWIHDCYNQKELLNWKKYILGQNTYSDDEDEEDEEIDDEEEEYVPPVQTNKKRISILDDDEDEEVDQMKEVIGFNSNAVKDVKDADNEANDDIYDMETDSESATADNNPIRNDSQSNCNDISSDPKAIDIFKAKSFCFYGPFDENEKQILTQYIITHSGILEDEISERVRYVVTNSEWNDTFEQACASNDSLIFVRPKWIHKCHEKSKLIPFQAFIVTSNYD